MTNRRITVTNPRLTLRRRACRFIAGPSMSNADHYGRKIKRELDAHKRSEREAMKTVPTIGDFLWLGVCVMAGIGIGYLIAAYIVAMSPEAFEPARPVSIRPPKLPLI